MQTVTFQCGSCQNLMAVGIENLGRQVRCPHCQQVVVAPAQTATAPAGGESHVDPTPAPAPEPAPVFTPRADGEDIFSADPDDALFGREEGPRLKIPPQQSPMVNGAEAAPPEPAPEPAAASEGFPSLAELLASGSREPAPATEPEPPPSEPQHAEPPASEDTVPSWMSESSEPASQVATLTAETAPGEEAVPAPAPRRVRREGNRLFLPLVFMPLILYAVLTSVIIALLYAGIIRVPEPTNRDRNDPFDQLPDDGDDSGTKKGGKRITLAYPPEDVTRPITPARRVKLGNTLRVGSIEVTPLRVTRERVGVYVRGYEKATNCGSDSLVLYLRLKNVSTEERFAPLDTFFDRLGTVKRGSLPLTHLEVGGFRVSGPAKWAPPTASDDQPQWLKGRDYSFPGGVGPDEEYKLLDAKGKRTRDPFVCTDGNNPDATRVLFGEDEDGKRVATPHPGPFLWRIQLRRGVVLHRGKERSATTVVGVEFTRDDITNPEG
jgi:hypothetical protein